MADRERLDILLYRQGLFPSRSKAQRAIMAGQVYVNDRQVDKAGTQVHPDDDFEVRGSREPYVSRGGRKLKKALEEFEIRPEGLEVIDVGASTGGFTDCLLQEGAKLVYAIDVGHGQLAWKLRQDDRVKVIENTNFRHLTPEDLPVCVPLIVIDVSFISLRLIIPAALKFLQEKGQIVTLIKPQFEAGRERVGSGGVVKEKKVHIDVLTEICSFFNNQGLEVCNVTYSPITGASSKNIEFLAHLKQSDPDSLKQKWQKKIEPLVNRAHRKLVQ